MPRVIDGFTQFFDNDGSPLVAGKLLFTESGSNNTNKDTYSDNDETTPNTNPVILDASGRCPDVFGTGSYRVTSYDSDDVQIEQFDPMPGASVSGDWEDWDIAKTYAARDIVVGSDGVYYRSLVGSNTGNDPASGGQPTYWEVVQLLSVFNVNQTYAVDDIVLWTDGVLYTCETATTAGDTPVSAPTKWSPDITLTTVASHATTSAIWVVKNSIISFTGAETITDFPAATKAGEERTLICAGACVFTHAGNITVQGGVSYTAAANETVIVTALTTTTFHVQPTGSVTGNAIMTATSKTTPADADAVALADSAASNILKKLTWANVKATLKTYFDTLYSVTGAMFDLTDDTTPQLSGNLDLNGNDINEGATLLMHVATTHFRLNGGGSTSAVELCGVHETTNAGLFRPLSDGGVDLGGAGNRWKDVYATNGTIQTSDKNQKQQIKALNNSAVLFINALEPVSYVLKDISVKRRVLKNKKWVTEVHSIKHKRPHFGFTAQQVKDAMDTVGLKDFAGFIHDKDSDVYALRYEEFIAPLVKAVQELTKRVNELEGKQ